MHIYLNYYQKKLLFSLLYIRMSVKIINFDKKKNRKNWLLQKKKKKKFNIYDTDVNKILVSKIEPYGTNNALRYFVGYNDIDAIRPLYLRLSKMTGYIIIFDKNKNKNTITISLKVNGKQNYM